MNRLLSLILLLYIPALLDFSCRSLHSPDSGPYLTVTRVVDGDTFWADDGSPEGLKIRLIGLDAPETHKSVRKEAGYYGMESKDYLKALLSGKKVRLEYDVVKYDRYNRTLAYVFLEDGTFVNAELIKGGYAMVYTVPPNVKYTDEFLRLQRKARRQKKGMWEKEGRKTVKSEQ
ncbi:MAG: thermonuclease family protein [Bacteroidales bacterium]|nr:thermonuclease family protein [Bacteroidales bacterium]